MGKLQEFLNKNNRNAIVPGAFENDKGESYLIFVNGYGQIASVEDMRFIIEELNKTVEFEGIDQFISESNKHNYMFRLYGEDPDESDKLNLPIDRLRIKKKKFNPYKRKWSFNCDNCSENMSSDNEDIYYSINPYFIHDKFIGALERACSKECVYVIAKDVMNNWLIENDDKDLFGIKNMDVRIKSYIDEL